MPIATPKQKTTQRIKMRIHKGDTVQVITGKDKGKTGEVLRTLPIENRVIVQGVNIRTRHVKPTQEGAIPIKKRSPVVWSWLSKKTAAKNAASKKPES